MIYYIKHTECFSFRQHPLNIRKLSASFIPFILFTKGALFMKHKRFFSLLFGTVLAFSTLPFAAFAESGEFFTVDENAAEISGISDSYSYGIQLYEDKNGSGSLTLGAGCTFSAEWQVQAFSDLSAYRGIAIPERMRFTDNSHIDVNYAADYTASENGYLHLGVCGHFSEPDTEFYIIEDWVNWCQAEPNGKMVTIDGAQYLIFKYTKMEHDFANGTVKEITQYYSVRQSKRTSGHITVSDHIRALQKIGMETGYLTDVTLRADAYDNTGSMTVSKLFFDVYGLKKEDTQTAENSDFPAGDVNCDNLVTIADAVLLQKHLLGNQPLTDTQYAQADISGDGSVSAADLTLLKHQLLYSE